MNLKTISIISIAWLVIAVSCASPSREMGTARSDAWVHDNVRGFLTNSVEVVSELKQLMISEGIGFPPGSSISYDPTSGFVTITNTVQNLNKIKSIYGIGYERLKN